MASVSPLADFRNRATPRFSPLRLAPLHYVPVLQDRFGEMDALSHMVPGDWGRTTPLMVIVGPKGRSISRGALAGRAKRVAEVLGDNVFFVDLLRIDPRQSLGAVSALGYVLESLRSRGATFLPVAHLDGSIAAARVIRDAAALDGRGAALRVRIDRVTPSQLDLDALAAQARDRLGLAPGEIDLILDLAYLPPDQDVDEEMVVRVVQEWLGLAAWRSATLLGTSMPQTLGMVNEGSIGALPRREWATWLALRKRHITVNYGDYGIQHPTPPEETGPGMRANIRYTMANRTVIARGVGPVTQGIGSAAYVDLAVQLWGLPDFSTKDFSWGDAIIEECAEGLRPRSSQQLWRGAGASHHIRTVVDQLARTTF